MSDKGIAAYYSSTAPLLLNEGIDRVSQECVKDVSPKEQDFFHYQCQAWQLSLSKVSYMVTPLFLVLCTWFLSIFLIGKKENQINPMQKGKYIFVICFSLRLLKRSSSFMP